MDQTRSSDPITRARSQGEWRRRLGDGTVSEDGLSVEVPRGIEERAVVIGPYVELPAGRYSIAFDIALVDPLALERDEMVAFIDVVSEYSAVQHAKTRVFGQRLAQTPGPIEVGFELDRTTYDLEFRIWTTGVVPLRFGFERPLRRADPRAFVGYPMVSSEESSENNFFLENRDQIRNIYENGGLIELADRGARVRFGSVSYLLQSRDDFIITDEIFIDHDYHIATTEDLVAIDVGMNIGLASLYLANLPNVVEVHAYEPFPAVYARAVENFALNPDLSKKISPHPYGLSDRTETLSVLVSDGHQIGLSVRGAAEGTERDVQVKDAARELGPVVRDARRRGLDVLLKLDCEGSEFAILESLDRAGLLDQIDVIMMEWHKWWSRDLTAKQIVERLKRFGFIAFDHTRARDFHSGNIYAVRRPAAPPPPPRSGLLKRWLFPA